MASHTYRILLGATLALCVGAAGAQNYPDKSARMPVQKGATSSAPAQPSQRPADKMSADPNASSQGTAATENTAEPGQSAAMHHARKSVTPRHEAVSPEERSYREALRQCAQERNDSQRDACLDNAIGKHESNG